MCEFWRNTTFAYCFLPFLVALLLHLCCTSDSSPCLCLSLLLETREFQKFLSLQKLKYLFFLPMFCLLQIKDALIVFREWREWSGTWCQVCQRLCRANVVGVQKEAGEYFLAAVVQVPLFVFWGRCFVCFSLGFWSVSGAAGSKTSFGEHTF